MEAREAVLTVLEEVAGCQPKGLEETDLVRRCGIDGDDFSEVLKMLQHRHGVDFSGYLWYFHQLDEPPFWRRVVPIDESGRVLPLIPVSVDALAQAVATGRWSWDYPPHQARDRSGRVLVVLAALVAGLGGLVFFAR